MRFIDLQRQRERISAEIDSAIAEVLSHGTVSYTHLTLPTSDLV